MAAPNGAALGRRIRSLRIEKGLTLKQIEARVGISATHVSEVERGRTSPTVGALARIAEALGVRPSHLIDFPVGKPQTISRRGSRLQLAAPDGRASSDVLIPADPEAEVSMFLVTLAPGFTEGVPGESRIGDKIFRIIEGEADLELGDQVHRLVPGDTIQFRSNVSHRLINRSSSVCRLLWVMWPRMTI
ncbi:MAG: XRE family transcriptional regulator [Candidatus Eisenbacteria bacterium]|nr:XRE family transcriptional regulator [Candidatus Eisenbacteria bacterium]